MLDHKLWPEASAGPFGVDLALASLIAGIRLRRAGGVARLNRTARRARDGNLAYSLPSPYSNRQDDGENDNFTHGAFLHDGLPRPPRGSAVSVRTAAGGGVGSNVIIETFSFARMAGGRARTIERLRA